MQDLDAKIAAAYKAKTEGWYDAGYAVLQTALQNFTQAKLPGGGNPYAGNDPGKGPDRTVRQEWTFDADTAGWETGPYAGDDRIHTEGTVSWETAFGDGKLKLDLAFDGIAQPQEDNRRNTMDGLPLQNVLPDPLDMTGGAYIQFDMYYPMDSAGKLMRFELWSGAYTAGKTQGYVRPDALDYLNGPVAGEYGGQTYRIKTVVMKAPATSGTWQELRLDLHGETNAAYPEGALFLDNIKIIQEEGDPIPETVNLNRGRDLPSLAERYQDLFMFGNFGGLPNPELRRHFTEMAPGNALKADAAHPYPPDWLAGDPEVGQVFADLRGSPEYAFAQPDAQFAEARGNGYVLHGHVLAWYNQAPRWLMRIAPKGITGTAWNPEGNYISGSAANPAEIDKETARRVYYNHILHEMRHFSSVDERYAETRLANESSSDDGVIAVHSWDVLNEEMHESRHSAVIPEKPGEWKTALRNTAWLRAMTGDDYGDITQHFVYLLFKYAHIAVPNRQMAERYKAHYADLPVYMKNDGHDDQGSIDAFITANPPVLYFNEYGLNIATKAKAVYNMIKEVNAAWLKDPLYDGRNLIEGLGMQGHYAVSPDLAGEVRASLTLFKGLIDEGLLNTLCISELDMKVLDSAPGGATAGGSDPWNQKQADAHGYQYALLFKLFAEFSPYLERVSICGPNDQNWYWTTYGHTVIFDRNNMANPAYYGCYDPDRFIRGHSYLDAYFQNAQN
jgi:GH35 family endo-1,4-beta-xylanase